MRSAVGVAWLHGAGPAESCHSTGDRVPLATCPSTPAPQATPGLSQCPLLPAMPSPLQLLGPAAVNWVGGAAAELVAVGRGLQVGGATAVMLWGHPQLGLLLLTLTDPQESRPQAKEGIDTSCLRPPASAQTMAQVPTSSPGNWPLPTGDHSQMASLSGRLSHLTLAPSSQTRLIKT